MRKKLLIGALIAVSLVIAVGGHFFGRTNAQSPPEKSEKSDKDLFDTIKQSLEGKKPENVPPLPVPAQPSGGPLAPLPSFPSNPAPIAVPPPAMPPLPQPTITTPKPAMPPVNTVAQPVPPAAPQPNWTLQPTSPQPAVPTPPLPPGNLTPDVPPAVQISPAKIADDLGKIKDSPWIMHVEVRQGQTILTATLHLKHEFRIVCQNLDVQTGKGTLRAVGKVQITGDMLIGNCDQLAISLLEDRLLLEGNALVSIQKLPTNVSTEPAASFELKGTTLDLRISELQSKFRQTSLSVERDPANASPRAASTTRSMERDGKQWTPYGKLVSTAESTPSKDKIWRLEGNDGTTIALLIARAGGTLAQFEGQNISVLGTSELNGQRVLRVTHVALP